jgi:hypothetical protein
MVSAFIVFCEKKKVFGLPHFSWRPFPVAAATRTRPWRAGCFCFGLQATRLPLQEELRKAVPHWRKRGCRQR